MTNLPSDPQKAVQDAAQFAANYTGYNQQYVPGKGIDPALGQLDRSKIEALMKKIRDHCCLRN